ncbi:ABC transporter ATP-binding protein [Hyphomicrobium facile]|uniref:NitT/TauT family transport system ATP-binding protein n=1 Tax=Hyphomicrobium facile TaxID=51670 RepID=A0A1I7MUR6_9HYPH|nr:ABC transporter ATP-binding protein [Hyphomicrobium facile]SFV26150.1 NitT/TauT family transport system ATP-binding protein [Hyphomicrobium facile]
MARGVSPIHQRADYIETAPTGPAPHLHVVDPVPSHAQQKPRLSLDGVTVNFGARAVSAVQDVSLTIGAGEFVALLGPSGCGKSTLLNVMAGFCTPVQGRVLLDGEPLTGPSAKCGVVFQKHSLFPWMTALDNVAFGPRRLGLTNARQIAQDLLDIVGLAHVANEWPASLSGGMQQRVGIARALATRPPVLLMDEPFGALDAQTRSLMQEELLSIWDKLRPTVVFVTHDIEEAIFLADRVVVMQTYPGRIAREFAIDIPRPRSAEVLNDHAFIERRREITDVIRVEARKTFR